MAFEIIYFNLVNGIISVKLATCCFVFHPRFQEKVFSAKQRDKETKQTNGNKVAYTNKATL